jgi:hypothetical protein
VVDELGRGRIGEVDDVTPVGDNWETRYHNGYVFSGDTDRGMDVFVPTGS